MRYMLLMSYADAARLPPMSAWAPADARARGDAMTVIHMALIVDQQRRRALSAM